MREAVYDILDCGPRQRFCANGKLVHNSNFQNFKKPDPDLPPDENPNIRDAILAPEGWVLIKPDCSNVECRILNAVAGQTDVIERFRNGEDPYVNVASQFYGYPVNKRDHPTERQCGKVLELQAGYGSGGEKIRHTLRIKTKGKVILTPEEGIAARNAYRDTHPAVVDLWKQGGRMLARLAGGPPTTWGPCEVRDHRIVLPNKTELIYDTLEFYRPESEDEIYTEYDRDGWWRMKTRAGKDWKWTRMYGAKLVENLIQALARVVVSQAMLRVVNMGYRVVGMEHDSLWILIPEQGAEEHAERCRLELCREVPWLPGLPLDAEVTLK